MQVHKDARTDPAPSSSAPLIKRTHARMHALTYPRTIARMHTSTCAYTRMHTKTRAHLTNLEPLPQKPHAHTHVPKPYTYARGAHICAHICARIRVHACTCMQTPIWIRIYACMHACMHICASHACAHTLTHSRGGRWLSRRAGSLSKRGVDSWRETRGLLSARKGGREESA